MVTQPGTLQVATLAVGASDAYIHRLGMLQLFRIRPESPRPAYTHSLWLSVAGWSQSIWDFSNTTHGMRPCSEELI